MVRGDFMVKKADTVHMNDDQWLSKLNTLVDSDQRRMADAANTNEPMATKATEAVPEGKMAP
jgi:hypothetical protein